jgi:S-formylglutathione hydrolase FrmB
MQKTIVVLFVVGLAAGCSGAEPDAAAPPASGENAGPAAAPVATSAPSRFRAIVGVSMGGYAAAHLGLKHHTRFDVIGCAGGLVDMDHFLWKLRANFLGGFRGEKELAWTFEALPTEGQTVLNRNSLVQFFQDFTRGFGNFATYNVASPYWPPAAQTFDDEYNPAGTLRSVPFSDGKANDRAMEVLLAVDVNGNGQRDPGEPIVRNFYEPWRDVGADGLASASEPGYDAATNPDPAHDDYDPLHNPGGTEGNLRYDSGEPFDDIGIDGVRAASGIPVDFGEANGAFDVNPNLARYFAGDPRRLLATADLARLSIWVDAGIRDVFQFHLESDRFVGELRRLGADIKQFDGFTKLPGAPTSFDAAAVSWQALPRHVYVRYGNPTATPDEIKKGDGGHVGDFGTMMDRFSSIFYFVSNRFEGGDTEATAGDGATRIESFDSRALGRTMTYGLFLPPGYDEHPERRYPVVYLLHGYGQKPEDLFAPLGLLVGPAMTAGRLQKMIIVIPDGRSLEGSGSAYVNRIAPVAGDTGRYEDFVMQDVLADVETRFRTSARDPKP